MAGRRPVKLFLFNQTFYSAVGIHLTRPNPNHCSFNWKNWTLFICLGQSVASIVAFLLLDAEYVADIGMSAYFLLGLFLCSMLHLIPSQQVENTSEFIDSCEVFTESSKSVWTFRKNYVLDIIVYHFGQDHMQQSHTRDLASKLKNSVNGFALLCLALLHFVHSLF